MTFENAKLTQQFQPTTRRMRIESHGLAIVSMLCFSLAILLTGMLFLQDNMPHLFLNPYLIPWILLVFVVVSIPLVFLIARGSFKLFHPLVYAAWIYFLPAFVLGSFSLVRGNYPWYFQLIPNPEYYLPLTLVYIALGFVGLTLGFAIPLGRRIGRVISQRLPVWDWDASDLFRPALVLVIVGELFNLAAFSKGSLGYQSLDEISTFGATLYMLGLLSTMGSFLLWFSIFRAKRLRFRHYLGAGFLISLMLFYMVLGGGKGGLLTSTVLVIGAYVFSGRRIKVRHFLFGSLIISMALVIGVSFGTIFRQIKGNEAQMSLQEYFTLGIKAFDQLNRQSIEENVSLSANVFFQRIETVSQLAVFVSNYARLQPLEASYGIADIWTTTWTAFIPRAIWPDKPNVSGARGLGALYFNFGDSSPAISPMVDLLRNFGPIGIVPGMALLGVVLNIMYTALIQSERVSVYRTVGYYLLLTNVSYEGMYGGILPILIRVCVVFFIGLVLLYVMMPRRSQAREIRIKMELNN